MRASTSLGFAVAAVVACGVVGFSVFGDRHEDWLLRAAQDAAVRCVTDGACTRINGRGEVVANAPRLAQGVCSRRSDWQAVMSAKKRAVPFVVTCTDGQTYLFHIGKLRDAGEAQVLLCAEPTCAKEVRLFL